jgi:hypothetical protein
VRAASVFLLLNRLSTTNRMALMAAPNNLRSRTPMNLRGRMSVSYSMIHETAPQGDSRAETCGCGSRGRKLTGDMISRRNFLKLTGDL